MNDVPPDNSIPRGALVVVAIGLIACVAAALLATGKGEGEAAHLEWVKTASIPSSKPVAIPGGKQTMELSEGGIRSTGTNVSGYALYRVASVLKIGAGAPIGSGRILCSVKAPQGAEIAQTSGNLRATYPRSSEDGIYGQPVPETILVNFSSHGSELALLEMEDLPNRFTTERGVKLGWPEYKLGTERLKYYLSAGKPHADLELPFQTVWKTTIVPSAKIACTLTTSAGKATVCTAGALQHVPPPIDEQAEEEKAEEEEEKEAEKEG
jgi:hypothetical protein